MAGNFKGVMLGVMAPSLVEQFASMLPAEAHGVLDHFQRDNEALSRVRLRQLVPDGVVDKARDRLTKRVVDLLLKHGAITEKKL